MFCQERFAEEDIDDTAWMLRISKQEIEIVTSTIFKVFSIFYLG